MANPPYSASLSTGWSAPPSQFLQYPGGASQLPVISSMEFTAPTGSGGGLAGFRVDVVDATTNFVGACWFMGPGNTRVNRSYHWRGRCVMHVGAGISVTTFDNGWSWSISGFLLMVP